MTIYFEYELDNGTVILVEGNDEQGGVVKASSGGEIIRVGGKFAEALESVKRSARLLREKLDDLIADEIEVKFGLKATGEVGNSFFAIGKLGTEANYEVTLKWKKSQILPSNDSK